MRGDGDSFSANWETRSESLRLHYSPDKPETQLELAFGLHHKYVRSKVVGTGKLDVLEAGAGRGSLGAHFASQGDCVTLLDISHRAMEIASEAYALHSLQANFVVADCLEMPFDDDSFDLVCSIGLLEHFSSPESAIAEQIRVLRPGGTLCSYVVPEHTPTVQAEHNWVNELLTAIRDWQNDDDSFVSRQKTEVFRTDFMHDYYELIYEQLGLVDVSHDWVYPIPMISHSVDFPFTLLPPRAEEVLVRHFEGMLVGNGKGLDWTCEDFLGQAFFVTGIKPWKV